MLHVRMLHVRILLVLVTKAWIRHRARIMTTRMSMASCYIRILRKLGWVFFRSFIGRWILWKV
jgi:hypothetical protein